MKAKALELRIKSHKATKVAEALIKTLSQRQENPTMWVLKQGEKVAPFKEFNAKFMQENGSYKLVTINRDHVRGMESKYPVYAFRKTYSYDKVWNQGESRMKMYDNPQAFDRSVMTLIREIKKARKNGQEVEVYVKN